MLVKRLQEHDFNVAVGVIYGVASFRSWFESTCNPKTRHHTNPRRILPPFEGEHLEHAWTSRPTPMSPKDKPIWFRYGWLEILQFIHMYSHYDLVDRRW